MASRNYSKCFKFQARGRKNDTLKLRGAVSIYLSILDDTSASAHIDLDDFHIDSIY